MQRGRLRKTGDYLFILVVCIIFPDIEPQVSSTKLYGDKMEETARVEIYFMSLNVKTITETGDTLFLFPIITTLIIVHKSQYKYNLFSSLHYNQVHIGIRRCSRGLDGILLLYDLRGDLSI